MASNEAIERARRYHELTAHSPRSVRESRHTLDWRIKPSPFKLYPDLPAIALPRELPAATADTFDALTGPVAAPSALELDRLAALLHLSAGITRSVTYPGGAQVYFRAAPSTGALYQTEVYVVAGNVAGLEPGAYHFGPGDFALRRLRAGDLRGAVARASADEDVATRPATLILSGLYWRNTWKYQARGYRHLFWDSGTMLAQVLAAASALGRPARAMSGFVDAEINALLGLDPEREGALVLIAVGEPTTPVPARAPTRSTSPAPSPPPLAPIAPAVIPLSASEVRYPLLVEAYADSSLDHAAEVLAWRERASRIERPVRPGAALVPLPPPLAVSGRALGETIERRGSTREFSGEAISAEALSSVLHHATRAVAADVPSGLVELYLTIHAVDGIAPGAYAYHPAPHALERLTTGDLRADSAFLCLDQALGGMSSATVFFLADLDALLGALGNRGYRVANLEAGIVGGRLYLGAYAQRFGATGLTFYDAEVTRFFSPHAAGKDALFVTALGRSVKAAPKTIAPLHIRR